jgi:PhnB protein
MTNMATLTPYLYFDGNCRDAMNFYQRCFGGKLEVMTYGDTQGEGCPLAARDKVMHAALTSDALLLMASDDPEGKVQAGSNVHISVNCNSLGEIEELFTALSQQGNATTPLHDAFWGDRFGTLTDQFGFLWMLNCRLPKQE